MSEDLKETLKRRLMELLGDRVDPLTPTQMVGAIRLGLQFLQFENPVTPTNGASFKEDGEDGTEV